LALPSAFTLNLRAVSDGISLSQTISAALTGLFDGLQELAGAAQRSLDVAQTRQERLALNELFTAERRGLKALVEATAFAGRKVLTGTGSGATFQVGDGAGQTVTVRSPAVDLDTLGGTRWQVLQGGRACPEAPGARQGLDYVASNGGLDDLEIQGVPVSLEGVRTLDGALGAINAHAETTQVTATRAEGNPLWLWRPKAADAPPMVGRGSGIALALGLGSYRSDTNYFLPFGETTVASWGEAKHALAAVRQALEGLAALRRDALATEGRFEALVALAEEEALHRSGKGRLRNIAGARLVLASAREEIRVRPGKALVVQGNSTPMIVLKLMEAR
jgi:flagellin